LTVEVRPADDKAPEQAPQKKADKKVQKDDERARHHR
jgi:hypothetical protein